MRTILAASLLILLAAVACELEQSEPPMTIEGKIIPGSFSGTGQLGVPAPVSLRADPTFTHRYSFTVFSEGKFIDAEYEDRFVLPSYTLSEHATVVMRGNYGENDRDRANFNLKDVFYAIHVDVSCSHQDCPRPTPRPTPTPGPTPTLIPTPTPTLIPGPHIIELSGTGPATNVIDMTRGGIWEVNIAVSGNQNCVHGNGPDTNFSVWVKCVDNDGTNQIQNPNGEYWLGHSRFRISEAQGYLKPGKHVVSIEAKGDWVISFKK